jgi:2-aminobenzoate-CoA ligase
MSTPLPATTCRRPRRSRSSCSTLPELQFPARLNCATELLDRPSRRGPGDRVCIRAPAGCAGPTPNCRPGQPHRPRAGARMGLVPGNRVLLRGANNADAGGLLVRRDQGRRHRRGHHAAAARQASWPSSTRPGQPRAVRRRLADELHWRGACPTLRTVRTSTATGGDGLAGGGDGAPAGRFDNVDTAADDTCLIAFTSGTTGVPKGTMHFHRDVMAACALLAAARAARPRPTTCSSAARRWPSPSGWAACCCSRWRWAPAPCCWRRPRPPRCWTASELWRHVLLHRAHVLPRDGRAWRLRTTTPLRKCVSAGEALPAATRALWKEATGIEIIDGIGATELLHIFISADEAHARPGATGVPVPGYRAEVVDERRPAKLPARPGRPAGGARAPPAAATWPTRARPPTCRTAGTSPATPTSSTPTATSSTRRAPTT